MLIHARPSPTSNAVRAGMIGIAAGLRSMTPFGVLASKRNDSAVHGRWEHWPVMRSRAGRIALQLAWFGELVGDKLPGVPPRTNPGPLAGRMVFGAIAGMAISTQHKGTRPRVAGALVGAIGGFIGSHAGYSYRTVVTKKTGIPDLPVALLEDITAWTIANKAIQG